MIHKVIKVKISSSQLINGRVESGLISSSCREKTTDIGIPINE